MSETLEPSPSVKDQWTGWRPFIIESKQPESGIITSFILRPQDGKPVTRHLPGQHLTFLFDIPGKGETKRNYTISCDANGETYRISVKREPDGTSSRWLHDEASLGTIVKVMPPSGSFVLPNGQQRPVVFLSAGVGLTPMVAMMEAVADRHPTLRAAFVHCAADGSVHAFGPHVRALAEKHGGTQVTTFYSAPRPEDVEGRDFDHAGRLTMDWLRENTPLTEADYYVCGPLPFLRAFVSGLAKAGVPQERVNYEFFGPVEDLLDDPDPSGTISAAKPLPSSGPYKRTGGTMIDKDDIGRAILGSASDAVVASDREGTIILWNPGAERIFGFTEEEALGQSLDIIIPEPFRARHWEGYHQTVASGQSRYGAGDMLAVPGLKKDGTRNSLEFTIVLITGANGQVDGMVSVLRDVTKTFMEAKALKKQIAELTKPAG
jgi:PAS domain S-box-containing protein